VHGTAGATAFSTRTTAASSPPAAAAATSSTPTRSATPRGRRPPRLGGTLAWLLDDSLPLDSAEQARAVVDGLVLGGYDRASGRPSTPRHQPTG
jgi:hypothetical protein